MPGLFQSAQGSKSTSPTIQKVSNLAQSLGLGHIFGLFKLRSDVHVGSVRHKVVETEVSDPPEMDLDIPSLFLSVRARVKWA